MPGNPTTSRLLNQQLAAPQFSDPAELVAHMGAVQAQEYRMMRWAVCMRTRRPSLKAFKRAYDSGRIIRLHLLRGTWQLVAGEDYHWMLALCGPKARAVIKGWMSSNGISLPEDEIRRVRDVLMQSAAGRSSTKEDFAQALLERDMIMSDQRLSYHIRMAELDGDLCSGELLPLKASYALTTEKLGTGQGLERDEALMRLALKYFQSHQPATFEDFVWWTGMGVNDCRRGISLLGDRIHSEKWHGREFYITDDCRTRGHRSGSCLFIPPYDEYLIGYKSRDIALEPQFSHRAHNNSGIFQPVIALDGKICGNWSPSSRELRTDFFSPAPPEEAVFREWERYKHMG